MTEDNQDELVRIIREQLEHNLSDAGENAATANTELETRFYEGRESAYRHVCTLLKAIERSGDPVE